MKPLTQFLLAVPAGVAGIVCLSLATMTVAADKVLAAQAPRPVTWEHKKVRSDWPGLSEAQLDQLGTQGWELCSVQTGGSTFFAYTYFKRRKP